MKTEAHPSTTKSELPRSCAEAPRALNSTTLLGGRGEVEIAHEGKIYRLSLTRQGKLILTK